MSVEDAKKLLEKARKDPAVKKQLNKAGIAGFSSTAKDLGLSVSLSDLTKVIKQGGIKGKTGALAKISGINIDI